MGIAYGKLGHLRHAMHQLELALALVRLDVYGEVHAEIAVTLQNIGNSLQQARDYVGTIQCFGDAKRILEQVHGTHDRGRVGAACV